MENRVISSNPGNLIPGSLSSETGLSGLSDLKIPKSRGLVKCRAVVNWVLRDMSDFVILSVTGDET